MTLRGCITRCRAYSSNHLSTKRAVVHEYEREIVVNYLYFLLSAKEDICGDE